MSLMNDRQSQCHNTPPSLYTSPSPTIIHRSAFFETRTINIAYTYLILCRGSAIEEAIVQPPTTTRACNFLLQKSPDSPSPRLRCQTTDRHVQIAQHDGAGKTGLTLGGGLADFIPARWEGRVPLRANPQAGSVQMRTCTSGSPSRWCM